MLCVSINKNKLIEWIGRNYLEDLDFADDLILLSYRHQQIQMKTTNVAAISASMSLNIHKGKSKILRYNTENINPIPFDWETLEEVESTTEMMLSEM